jgi:hypothetical protein
MIEKLDSKFTATQKSITEIKKKAIQAKSDKVELMRDLATYEINYSNMSSLKYRLENTHVSIQRALTLFQSESFWKNESYEIEKLMDQSLPSKDSLDQDYTSKSKVKV